MIVSKNLIESVGICVGSGLTLSGLSPVGITCVVDFHFYQVLVY